jgi:hypothetical protein
MVGKEKKKALSVKRKEEEEERSPKSIRNSLGFSRRGRREVVKIN